MIGVAVGFKALRDSVPDLQQTRASVLQLLLVRQTLVRLVQLLQGLLHWPHALLALHRTLAEFVAVIAVGFYPFKFKMGQNSRC